MEPWEKVLVDNVMSAIPEGWGVITADQINNELVERPDLFLIDVPTLGEVQEKGVIEAENFAHIPIEELVAQKRAWPADKDTPIAFYFGSDHRSTMAMTILWSYGYTDVRSLKGGFGGWVETGYPIIEIVSAWRLEAQSLRFGWPPIHHS